MTTEEQVQWRRDKVGTLLAQGWTQSQIAQHLQLSRVIVCQDYKAIREEAKARVSDLLDERLPTAFEMALSTLKDTKRRAYDSLEAIESAAQDKKDINHKLRMDCLRLISDIESKIVEVETHKDAIKAGMNFAKAAKNQLQAISEKTTISSSAAEEEEEEEEESKKSAVAKETNPVSETVHVVLRHEDTGEKQVISSSTKDNSSDSANSDTESISTNNDTARLRQDANRTGEGTESEQSDTANSQPEERVF